MVSVQSVHGVKVCDELMEEQMQDQSGAVFEELQQELEELEGWGEAMDKEGSR